MTDDDDTESGDFLFDLLKTLIALFFFIFFVAIIGGLLWGFLA